MAQQLENIQVVFNRVNFCRDDWDYPYDIKQLEAEVEKLDEVLSPLGYSVSACHEPERVVDVRGYPDLLNAIRVRSGRAGLGNLCLGHVIGCSANLDLAEDILRGVKRIAFAPETIEPDGSDKIVCHNCGCGC